MLDVDVYEIIVIFWDVGYIMLALHDVQQISTDNVQQAYQFLSQSKNLLHCLFTSS